MLVVGSENSSNSLRLRELAQQLGARAYLIDRVEQIQPEWVKGVQRVGVTAGASSPEYLTQAIVQRLRELGTFEIEEHGEPEPEIVFTMPREISLI
jgi:4-hydroxy-3-methylbut-2-enyl diphosphate reductase